LLLALVARVASADPQVLPRDEAILERELPAKPDPQMQAVLEQMQTLYQRPLTELTPAEARQLPGPHEAVKMLLKKHGKDTEPLAMKNVVDLEIPGPKSRIPLRIYTPDDVPAPLPVVVYWHGGGWVLGDLNTYDASCRALAKMAGCLVISCDYRHAPEHPFPAAADDAIAAYRWVLENSAKYGGDPRRVALAGESAGGNLAAACAQRARDEQVTPPVYQLLIYPVLDFNLDSPSYDEHAAAVPLNRPMMEWFWGHYLKDAKDADNPYASPLRAKRFDKLPPAMIITADIDPLRSEGEAYANELRRAGVPVEYVNYEGVTHEFFGMGAVVDKGHAAVKRAADGLTKAFELPSPQP
jgi:acetyl esterase/lipase